MAKRKKKSKLPVKVTLLGKILNCVKSLFQWVVSLFGKKAKTENEEK